MPRYFYTAKSDPTNAIQGEIEASSEQDAINKLNQMGYFPVSLSAEHLSLEQQNILRIHKVNNSEIILFTRQLASLLESGVNIIRGLQIIVNQTQNKYFKIVLYDIVSKIKDGKPLSDTLALHPKLFSGLYISMIYSGEVGGNLELSLKRLADFLEKEEEFRNSIRAALTYPFFVMAVGFLTVIVLLTFVIPRLVTMFEDMGQALPLPTRMLIDLSGFLRSYWWMIIAVITICVFVSRRLYKSEEGRLFGDSLKLKVKLWAELITKTEIGRLSRTLSLLLSSGITMVHALDISRSMISNQVLINETQKIKEQITTGQSFSNSIKGSRLFPDFVVNIITIGEESGSLEKALLRIADDYEKDVDRTLKTLSRLLEPAMILVMGLIVGFIVLSMLLPIFQINLIVQ